MTIKILTTKPLADFGTKSAFLVLHWNSAAVPSRGSKRARYVLLQKMVVDACSKHYIQFFSVLELVIGTLSS